MQDEMLKKYGKQDQKGSSAKLNNPANGRDNTCQKIKESSGSGI